MASTPKEALHEFLGRRPSDMQDREAVRERLASGATYPLFQGMPDGTKSWRTLEEDVEDTLRAFSVPGLERVELLSEDVVAETEDLTIFLLRTDSIGEDGTSLGRYQVLWCFARDGDEWKMSWRQWVGPA